LEFRLSDVSVPVVAPSAPSAADSSPAVESNVSETVENRQDQAQSAAPEVKKAPEAKKPVEAPKKFKLKVDGAEEEYDEQTLLKLAQLGKASDKRFQEASKLRKQAEDFLSQLKDPNSLRQVLANPAIGVDIKKFAEDYLLEEMEKAQLSPEQLKIKEYEAKLKTIEDERKSEAEKAQAAKQKQLEEHYAQEFQQKIIDAFQATNIPKNSETMSRMIKYMSLAVEHGMDLPAQNIAKIVENEYRGWVKTVTSNQDGEGLLAFLGDEVANKIRKADLARLKAKLAPTAPATPKAEQKQSNDSGKRDPDTGKFMNVHQWREHMEKLRNS
jgi:dUTPase